MRICFLVLAVFIAIPAIGTQPINMISLTPELAKKFGFDVKVHVEGEGEMSMTFVEILGPAEINGCVAIRSGSMILGSDDRWDAVYMTELRKDGERPKAFGDTMNESHLTLGIFLDYICSNGKIDGAGRYYIPSIKKWGDIQSWDEYLNNR
jgi:hypothetical protein